MRLRCVAALAIGPRIITHVNNSVLRGSVWLYMQLLLLPPGALKGSDADTFCGDSTVRYNFDLYIIAFVSVSMVILYNCLLPTLKCTFQYSELYKLIIYSNLISILFFNELNFIFEINILLIG
jgi:hypothetical protein